MGDSVRITHPVTVDMLLNIFHIFDWSNPLHVCMHAAFLVAFFSSLRISNLVPYKASDMAAVNTYFLKREDVFFFAHGAVLRIFKTKTIQFRQRVLQIPLPVIPNSILCPVAALKAYLSLVPAPLSAPLFMVPVANSAKPLLAAHFNRFLKACASATGFDPNHFSSRSYRQGGATFVFNCAAPIEFIRATLKLSTQKKLDILGFISSRLSHIQL